MRTYKSKGGHFSERPYYTNDEIDRICRAELDAVGLYPTAPEPVRIDRFIEKRFNVSVGYDDLGPGILGLTKFGKAGVKEVVVARALEEENTVSGERRVRSTIAHEAGHGVLHAHLFTVTGQCGLFPDGEATMPRVLCRDEDTSQASKTYNGEWWEYQANRAIAGFLLPRALVLESITEFMVPRGLLGIFAFDDTRTREAGARVAEVFNVNPVVARIRLGEMFPAEPGGQQLL